MQLVERRPGRLPMVFLVQIAKRDRVGEELVETLHALAADGFRQTDWQPHEIPVRLDLGGVLMRERRRMIHDVPVDGFSAHETPLNLYLTRVMKAAAVHNGTDIRPLFPHAAGRRSRR